MLRLGATEQALTELVAVGEHVTGLTVGAAGLRLDPAALVVPSDGALEAADDDLDREISGWARDRLGVDGLPAYWQALRAEPKFRSAHWRAHQVVLGAGEIDVTAKGLIAFAVASFRSSPYWVEYFARYCRTAFDVSEDELREAVLVAMHSAAYNTVSHGMMLEARYTDLRAEDFHDPPAEPAP